MHQGRAKPLAPRDRKKKTNQTGSSLRITSPGQFLGDGGIGCLWPVIAIKCKRPSLRTMRMRADPRISIRESPGLNRRTGWIVQTHPDDSPVYLRLSIQVFRMHQLAAPHAGCFYW